MAYRTYPMPDDYPDYPNHFQIARYFDDYVDHFGLRERIRFSAPRWKSVVPAEGEWEVTVEDADGERETHGLPRRAGRQRAPLGPALAQAAPPRVPRSSGASRCTFITTVSPRLSRGKRVLVLGIGNSATDIAVEASRIAEVTFLAMRRGAYVMPKYLNGKPTDEATPRWPPTCRCSVQRFVLARMLGRRASAT